MLFCRAGSGWTGLTKRGSDLFPNFGLDSFSGRNSLRSRSPRLEAQLLNLLVNLVSSQVCDVRMVNERRAPPGSPNRPRVLWVAPFFRPKCYGGAVQVYEQLAKRLKSVECVIVSQRLGVERDEIDRFDTAWRLENGSQIRRLERLELVFGPNLNLWKRVIDCGRFFREARAEWRSLVREVRPDLIVCGATLEAGWLMDRVPARIPYITYLHGEELAGRNASRFVWRYQFKKQIQAIRRAALNISVSRYTATKAAELAGIETASIQVLPNFVDLARFSPPADREAIRSSLGWNGRKIILTLSRLTPRKGIDKAILALAELRRTGRLAPEWLHVIAGRGEQEKELRALVAQVGAEPYTHFAGFVEDGQVPMYYGAADIFLQPNRDLGGDTEGFGIVFLEANACGTPCIGGIAGGTADAIRDGVTGFRVDAEDPSAIGEAVLRLTQSSELRQRMGLAGIEIVRREHQVDKIAERFERLVGEVLRSAGNPTALTSQVVDC